MFGKLKFTIFLLVICGTLLHAQTITPKEVAELEAKVRQSPDDVEMRGKLILHYQQGKTTADQKSLQRHRLALIQSNPQKTSSYLLGIWVGEETKKPEYTELKNEWLRQLAKFKTDPEVRLNVVEFLSVNEAAQAEKILLEGETIDAGNYMYPYRLMKLHSTQLWEMELDMDMQEKSPTEADRKALLNKIIAQSRKGLEALKDKDEAEQTEYSRKFLAVMAINYLELRDPKSAYETAHLLHKNLTEAGAEPFLYEYFRVVLSVKGRARLMEGNLEEARKYLLGSIEINENTSNYQSIVDTRFCEELLVKEGAATVIKYLELCEKLGLDEDERKILKKFQRQLREGRIPKFSEYRNNVDVNFNF